MVNYKKVLFSILSIFIGLVFILSAISKLPSLEQFGWTIVETTFLNWTFAEWSARLLIGCELFIGFLFVFHLKRKQIAIPFSLILLVVFSIYLALVWNHYGGDGNCGCFGELIPMTPSQSIIKNLILIALIVLLSKKMSDIQIKRINLFTTIILLISALAPFIWLPPESIYLTQKDATIQKPISLSLLYQSKINKAPVIELRKGKHIISFMSLTCSFCRKAAKRLRIMKLKYPELPFFLILNGDPSKLDEFWKDTKANNIDFVMFNGATEFTMMNDGNSLPTIKWVNDTTVVRESNYLNLDENEILEWIK
ncbi:MAG TPA: DoxX family protein [Chitinophagaceae bacterium]|nr:DoxX family protein [Chitinophagaceae bacterium]